MANSNKIAVVILAAGESSRMRGLKQLLPWKKTTLLGNSIKAANESQADRVYIVLGASAEEIKEKIKLNDLDCILNKNWNDGMGSSIACAIDHIMNTNEVFDGLLVMLCDQPLISAGYLNRIIDTFIDSKEGIVATAYEHSLGVPVIFHSKYFKELSKLEGESGAKKVIVNNQNDAIGIEPKGLEIDLDTKEEYEQAIKSIS